jgi:hypothetical protein
MTISIENKSPIVITAAMLAVIGLIMLLPTEAMLSKVMHDDFKSEYADLFLKMGTLFIIGLLIFRNLDREEIIEKLTQETPHLKTAN